MVNSCVYHNYNVPMQAYCRAVYHYFCSFLYKLLATWSSWNIRRRNNSPWKICWVRSLVCLHIKQIGNWPSYRVQIVSLASHVSRVPRVGDRGFAPQLEDQKLLYVPLEILLLTTSGRSRTPWAQLLRKGGQVRTALCEIKKTKIKISGHPTPQTEFSGSPMHR